MLRTRMGVHGMAYGLSHEGFPTVNPIDFVSAGTLHGDRYKNELEARLGLLPTCELGLRPDVICLSYLS